MVRQVVQMRTTFASARSPSSPTLGDRRREVRQSAAFPRSRAARLALAPFAIVLGAVAGVVFAVLLPICGIASIAEAMTRACWALVRAAFRREHRGALSHD
jgi:hypothetical protein